MLDKRMRQGTTISEVVSELGTDDVELAAEFIDDLVVTGTIFDSGLRRRGPDGELEIVWYATPEGKLALKFGLQ